MWSQSVNIYKTEMAYNVIGNWRFASPNKQTVGLQGLQNVGEAGVGASRRRPT
jgi:hypothetical protein